MQITSSQPLESAWQCVQPRKDWSNSIPGVQECVLAHFTTSVNLLKNRKKLRKFTETVTNKSWRFPGFPYSFPGIGNQLSFGSRNLMHNKIKSCMENQVILPDKPLHKTKQFYLYTAMAQPLLPCPGLCPSNSNRNSISQGYLLKTCP